jgi:hypothetical protein
VWYRTTRICIYNRRIHRQLLVKAHKFHFEEHHHKAFCWALGISNEPNPLIILGNLDPHSSHDLWDAPRFMIPKKDSSIRFISDFPRAQQNALWCSSKWCLWALRVFVSTFYGCTVAFSSYGTTFNSTFGSKPLGKIKTLSSGWEVWAIWKLTTLRLIIQESSTQMPWGGVLQSEISALHE